KGSRVLDLACGTGRWLNKLLLRGARLGIGIDCSPAMITAARRKPLLQGRLVRADCLALPLPSAAADFVMCSFAIGHFPEVEALAAELARVTSPQAAVYVSDVHPDAYRKGWRTGFRSNGQAVEITTFYHSLTNVRDAFGGQGLELTQCIEGELGEPEKPIFEQARRLDRFYQYKGWPAVFISRFSRPDSAQRYQGQ
ncbi:MAG: class I SAM-dependent methyltransferase, partial [Terriglobia bacterium]